MLENKAFWLVLIVLAVIATSFYLGFDEKQILAITIMSSFISGTLLFWDQRLAFAFLGVSILLVSGVLDVEHFVHFASLDIIAFLIAMMIFIGYLEKNKFFEFLLSRLIPPLASNPKLMLAVLLLASAFFASVVDEVTSILFMLSVVFNLTGRLRINPVPFILMVVFATNIGSSATAIGNPIGVMIALKGGFSFSDFLSNAAPISFISILILILVCFFVFRKEIAEMQTRIFEIKKEKLFEDVRMDFSIIKSGLLFSTVFTLLVLHHQIEEMLGIAKNSILLGAAFLGAGIAILLEMEKARTLVESRVDWWTLTFFIMLFSSVGALKYVGVTSWVADKMISSFGAEPEILTAVVFFSSGIISAMLDNVLAVATFIPVLESMGALGISSDSFWWALLFGGTFFGNLTVIGSTANIVAVGIAERNWNIKIGFLEWFKVGVVVTLLTISVALFLLYAQSGLLGGAYG
jgi:Na+/H+ antiporter NhaD/arsenite permease-like protein